MCVCLCYSGPLKKNYGGVVHAFHPGRRVKRMNDTTAVFFCRVCGMCSMREWPTFYSFCNNK